MKYILLISASIVFSIQAGAQTLDQAIKTMSTDIAQKVAKRKKGHLAFADFTNTAGKSDPVTRYITEQVELYLITSDLDLQIIDRKHVKLLMDENHRQSSGIIDESTAKSSVAFIKADGWVTGEVTSFGDQIKITIKVIDMGTLEIFAASVSDLINDPKIKQIIEADQNQRIPVDSSCLQNNTGDYCFVNNSRKEVTISIYTFQPYTGGQFSDVYQGSKGLGHYGENHKMSLNPGEKECFYNIKAEAYNYDIVEKALVGYGKLGDDQSVLRRSGNIDYHGTIKVLQCKTVLYTIR